MIATIRRFCGCLKWRRHEHQQEGSHGGGDYCSGGWRLVIVEHVLIGAYAAGYVLSWFALARFFVRQEDFSAMGASFMAIVFGVFWPILAIAALGSKIVDADDRRTNPDRIEDERLQRMAEFEEALRQRERNIERLERELGIGE